MNKIAIIGGRRWISLRSKSSEKLLVATLVWMLSLLAVGEQIKMPPEIGAIFQLAEKSKVEGDFARKEDLDVFRRQMEAGIDSTSAAYAALQLGSLRDVKFLELMWWRSSDPLVRICCVAGLVLQPVDDIQIQETKDRLLSVARRFQEQEATARLSEITLVFRNREQFQSTIWKVN